MSVKKSDRIINELRVNCEHDAADLIEQLQLDILKLETKLRELGYCPDCDSIPEHHNDEPFSSCACGTGEDYRTRPLQVLQGLLEENNK